MDEEKLSAEDERKLLALFEQASLNDYPNPNREGCPGTEFLRQLAVDRKSIPIRHPALTHITQCSPCFREFQDLRQKAARKNKVDRTAAVTGAAVLVLVLGVYFSAGGGSLFPARERKIEIAANLDLTHLVIPRGSPESESAGNQVPPQLQCALQDLKVELPLASEPGRYEIEVLTEDKRRPLAAASGEAQLANGVTTVSVKLDLSGLSPGLYSLAVRRTSQEWSYSPIKLVR